ncbi:MAG: recombinase family protein [Homoserinimonas sp.]
MEQRGYQLGYARVSTGDQSTDLQIDALEAARCDRIFVDKGVSGMQARRPELDRLLDLARSGDTLVVWKLDRLGRGTRNLLEFLDELKQRGVKFRSLTEGLTVEGPMGDAMITVRTAFAQLERDLLSERTKAGLAAARARGRVGGRPSALSQDQERGVYQLYLVRGHTLEEIGAMFGVHKSTVSRAINKEKARIEASALQSNAKLDT